ncbi:MAG: acylphosphatase [Methanosarcinales archaeon]|nr:acylphosphatase [Methanosarcinales archaeon]
MEKVKATVSGSIQNVGYRARVIDTARAFGLTGFVQNLNDGRVRIIAESDNGNLDGFLDAIRIKNTLINVDAVEVEHADATGDFDDFYKLVAGGETDERLDTAAEYLKKLISVTERGFSEMKEEMHSGFSEMKEEMHSGFGNLDSKMNVMIEKQNEMLGQQRETTAEIRGLREDLKSYMDRKFGEIESELDVIKVALKDNGILC